MTLPASACDTDRYRRADVVFIPLDRGYTAIYHQDARRFYVQSASDTAILERCHSLSTLDEHARACGSGEAQALDALRRLREVGLLESESEIQARCSQTTRPAYARAGVPIDTVGVPTRQRPRVLCRALESYWQNHRLADRRPEYVIVDSSDPATAAVTRARVMSLARRYGIEVTYHDTATCTAFARDLARQSGISVDVVTFAVLGLPSAVCTTGSARNMLALHAAGRGLLQVDDDTSCETARSLGHAEGLAIADSKILELFFAEKDFAARRPEACDFLGLHESLLGHSSASLARAALTTSHLDVSRASPEFTRRLGRASAHVVLTMGGTCGDSGHHSPFTYLELEGDSWRRLVRSKREYDRALRGRLLLRQVKRATLTSRPWCQAMNLAIDQTELLPPFVPVWANQDGQFAEMVAATLPDACFGWIPWTIAHRPMPRRGHSIEELRPAAAHIRISDVMRTLVRECRSPLRTRGTAARIEALGRHLHAVASLPDPSFTDAIRERVHTLVSSRLVGLELRLADAEPKPDYWVADLRRHIRLLRALLVSADGWLPADVCADVGMTRALASTRDVIQRVGELLLAWESIRAAARSLRGPAAC